MDLDSDARRDIAELLVKLINDTACRESDVAPESVASLTDSGSYVELLKRTVSDFPKEHLTKLSDCLSSAALGGELDLETRVGFAQALKELWPQLSPNQQNRLRGNTAQALHRLLILGQRDVDRASHEAIVIAPILSLAAKDAQPSRRRPLWLSPALANRGLAHFNRLFQRRSSLCQECEKAISQICEVMKPTFSVGTARRIDCRLPERTTAYYSAMLTQALQHLDQVNRTSSAGTTRNEGTPSPKETLAELEAQVEYDGLSAALAQNEKRTQQLVAALFFSIAESYDTDLIESLDRFVRGLPITLEDQLVIDLLKLPSSVPPLRAALVDHLGNERSLHRNVWEYISTLDEGDIQSGLMRYPMRGLRTSSPEMTENLRYEATSNGIGMR